MDFDSDGLVNYDEIYNGTDIYNADTDGDGLTDGEEYHTYRTSGTRADSDYDGLSDGDEVLVYGSSPHSSDSDGDGLRDLDEALTHGTDPADADSDGDTLNDFDELMVYDSDPLTFDGAPSLADVNLCVVVDSGSSAGWYGYVMVGSESTSGCDSAWLLAEVWDGPASGLVPVYRHTRTDTDGDRLSTDGVPGSDESDGELVFYAEAVGAGVGDTIYGYQYVDQWTYSTANVSGWAAQGFSAQEVLFESAN